MAWGRRRRNFASGSGLQELRIGVKVDTMLIVPLALAAAVLGVGFWLYTPDQPRAALEARYLALRRRLSGRGRPAAAPARQRPEGGTGRHHAARLRCQPAHLGARGPGFCPATIG